MFHFECIYQWFNKMLHCPLCRFDYTPLYKKIMEPGEQIEEEKVAEGQDGSEEVDIKKNNKVEEEMNVQQPGVVSPDEVELVDISA